MSMINRFKSKCLAFLLMIFLIVFSFTATACDSVEPDRSEAAAVEEIDQRLTGANNQLGFDIFIELQKTSEDEENLFISPSSILTALAMTYNGAEGQTREAMSETLHLQEMSLDDVNRAFADLLTILNHPDPDLELAVANSLWAREDIDFNEDFLDRNSNYYKAEISSLDFANPESADMINSWVEEQTRGAIEEIVQAPISPDTILFLINAIYFKGEWAEQFDSDLTRNMPFYLSDGTDIEHPIMFQNGEFAYLENELFQAVSLPYGKNERFSMYVILPSKEVGLSKFYQEMNTESWPEWTDSFSVREGEVGLPRFKFEYETSLNDVLSELGMGIAFDDHTADFSGMRPTPPPLAISDVKHKSFIEVNEEGTEAAAATSVEIEVTAMPEDDRFTMIVDRPFFFTITDNMTGINLFMGSVANPEQ